MLQLLMELLGYARKLVPLMELYVARRPAQPARDPATQEFQSYAAEALRQNRAELMELRSTAEGLHQRLRVLDEQAVALGRELARIAEQQRIIMIAVLVAAIASAGALLTSIIAVVRH
jgi:hypothetical protein